MPGGVETLVARDSLITPDRFFSMAAQRLSGQAVDAAELQRLILVRFFRASLIEDQARTEAARERARAAVDPVRTRVLQGEKIVGAHEQIGEAEEERLRAYQAEMSRLGMMIDDEEYTFAGAVGAVLFNALMLSIIAALLFFFRRPLYHDWRAFLLLSGLFLTVAFAASMVARLGLPSELIPVTFAALIVASLWDARLGLAVALVLALMIGGQTPFLGVTALHGGAGRRGGGVQRSHRAAANATWHFISIVSLAYIASAVTMGLLRARGLGEVGWSIGWGVTNAVVASLARDRVPAAARGVHPHHHRPDAARALRPQPEAAEAAVAGGARELRAHDLRREPHRGRGERDRRERAARRVGTYYHDIGKLVKPQYFIENQPRGRNPHDKLKPSMSAAIIRSHVLEGLKLAEQDKLARGGQTVHSGAPRDAADLVLLQAPASSTRTPSSTRRTSPTPDPSRRRRRPRS
jgi:cyclic-di-AMP phosphodiesterase PgpH